MIQSASERRALRLSVPNESSGVSKNDQSDSAHPVLTDELMVRVAVYGEESELEACEEVSGQGKSSPDLLVILQGEILVYDVDNHGGRREISHIYERQFTGELSLLTDKPSNPRRHKPAIRTRVRNEVRHASVLNGQINDGYIEEAANFRGASTRLNSQYKAP